MNALLAVLAIAVCAFILLFVPSFAAQSYVDAYGPYTVFDAAKALLLCAVLAGLVGAILSQSKDKNIFLVRFFAGALIVRVFVAALIFITNSQEFFGGDALTYDLFGYYITRAWTGDWYYQHLVTLFTGTGMTGSGWGMVYLTGAVYEIVGRNLLATQLVNAVLGASTAPLVFHIAVMIFDNQRTARIATMFVAFYPSLILWSSQGLKDGPIVFLLALSMFATLKIVDGFDVKYLAVIAFALFGLMSMRFYIFYIVVASIGITLIVGSKAVTAQSVLRQVFIICALSIALGLFGVQRFATAQFEQYGSLQQLQIMRKDAATSAESGFGQDIDVSTPAGALSAIPVGMLFLLFAPFPWQMASVRALTTLPEMLVWWGAFPLMITGIWFTIKFRARRALPIVIFTGMLTLAYAIFQGNVGTAYRQRSQLLLFYFVFVAVGYVVYRENREWRRVSRHGTAENLSAGQA